VIHSPYAMLIIIEISEKAQKSLIKRAKSDFSELSYLMPDVHIDIETSLRLNGNELQQN
jgi:hypothetical protein